MWISCGFNVLLDCFALLTALTRHRIMTFLDLVAMYASKELLTAFVFCSSLAPWVHNIRHWRACKFIDGVIVVVHVVVVIDGWWFFLILCFWLSYLLPCNFRRDSFIWNYFSDSELHLASVFLFFKLIWNIFEFVNRSLFHWFFHPFISCWI